MTVNFKNSFQLSSKVTFAAGHITSQGLSRITNMAVSVALARVLTPSEFGAVAAALLFYSAVISINGMMLGAFASLESSRRSAQGPQADILGASLVVWVPVALLGLIGSFLSPDALGPAMATISIALPLLVLHDMLRYGAFARRRPWTAAGVDAAWLCGAAIYALFSDRFPGTFLTGWCVAAALVTIGVLVAQRVLPDIWAGLDLLRAEQTRLKGLAADGTLAVASSHLLVAFAGFFVGLNDLAAIRGAQVLAGPLGIIHAALGVALMPRVAAVIERGGNPQMAAGNLVTLGTIFALACAAGSVRIPPGMGAAFLGETWTGAAPLLPVILIGSAAQMACLRDQTLVRCLPKAVKWLVVARTVATLLVIGTSLVGLWLAGAWGFVVGSTVGRILSLGVWATAARTAAQGF